MPRRADWWPTLQEYNMSPFLDQFTAESSRFLPHIHTESLVRPAGDDRALNWLPASSLSALAKSNLSRIF